MGKGTRASIESVEPRRLLASGVVSGLAFNDMNSDGVRQTGENWFAIAGSTPTEVTFYADLNGNGIWDAASGAVDAEPSSKLSAAGTYSVTVPRLGPIAIRAHYPIDMSKQNAAIYTPVKVVVLATDGQTISGQDFACRAGAVYSGKLYTDSNANGTRDTNEPTRAFATVFYDENSDGVWQITEPFAPFMARSGSTDPTYQLPVPAGEGSIQVRFLEETTTKVDPHAINPSVGQNLTQDFAITPDMRVSGKVFSDLDRNRKRRDTEAFGRERYVGNIRVWLDYNNNGKLDRGEPKSLTNDNGEYSIVHRNTALLSPRIAFRSSDTNTLAHTAKSGQIKFGSIQSSIVANFGLAPAQIRLRVYNDLDSSRNLSATEAGVSGLVVFLDANSNGKQDKHEQSLITDADGFVTFNGLATEPAPQLYKLHVRFSSTWSPTTNTVIEVQLDRYQTLALHAGIRRG